MHSEDHSDKTMRRAGYAFSIVSTFGAGLATVVGKWNLESITPLLMNSLIFSVATVMLTVTFVPRQGLRKIFDQSGTAWLWIVLFTASSWFAIWAFWTGVQRMDPSLAAFLNRVEVPIAIILGIIFLRERFTLFETIGAALSIGGIIIMRMTLRIEYSEGFWWVLVGSFFFGLTELISKIAVRHADPTVLAYIRNMFLAATYWIAFAGSGQDGGDLGRVWPGVIALGFIGPILSRLSYLQALKRLTLSKVAIISQGQPVFVILIALLAFGHLPTFREFIGGIFLTVGCSLMIISRPRAMAANFMHRVSKKE
jgi:uncharacterized membrane protein